jgi:hypothetical protein
VSPLRPVVRAYFVAFSGPLEGVIPWMYLDVCGLVTTAIGALVDPVSLALPLPWVRGDGSRATEVEVRAEWARIKSATWLATAGAGKARQLCALRLTPEGVEGVTLTRLDAMAGELHRRAPGFADWPAAAQLAALSMAWAVGVDGLTRGFPRCWAALCAERYGEAAEECAIRTEGNPGVVPRNEHNRLLLLAAQHQVDTGEDRAALLHEPPAESQSGNLSQADRAAALALAWSTSTESVSEALARDRRER